jgi:glucose/arabinose dehydrogenase
VPRDPQPQKLPLEQIRLPEGFEITLVSDRVPGARELAIGDQGTIFAGTRGSGDVYALRDADQNGEAEIVKVLFSNLNSPNGVAFRDGALYVAEIHRITRYDDIEKKLDQPPAAVVVRDDLPRDEWHGWKFIAFGPDGWLYVPVGAPCNVCERKDERYAAILRTKPGSPWEVFAKGIRNTVGFDWHPRTGELWFTDNGRDELGDDLPPDELNRAPRANLHFGFPYCHGTGISDPEFGRKKKCGDFVAPAKDLGPHVAALGMTFYDGTKFPAEYRDNIFIAEHGSWNRSRALGYRVMRVRLEKDQAVSYEVFAQGWLGQDGKEAWGRPVHVLTTPEGDLLLSDDRAGAIYRIRYRGSPSLGKGHDESLLKVGTAVGE